MAALVLLKLSKARVNCRLPACASRQESADALTASEFLGWACIAVLQKTCRVLPNPLGVQKSRAICLQGEWGALQDVSGAAAAREVLTRVLQRWGDQLSSSKGRADLQNPLSLGEALPLLPLSRSLFAGELWCLLSGNSSRLPDNKLSLWLIA